VTDVRALFGPIDIYLFDQLLRQRIRPGMRVFDAGCGDGRNIGFLLREGYDVFGVDADPRAIAAIGISGDRFRCERIEAMSFPDAFADAVLSSAVLHFARDDEEFRGMLEGSWRVLRPGGIFFCRLASSIGIETLVRPLGGRRYAVPDGSQRYLVDQELLLEWTEKLGGELLDPIKTTVVQNQRSMTTWVLQKC
jgi:tellurite methyltransferase